jgi:DNA-binding transcriptional regulator YiaG
LTPAEFKQARKALGLTINALASEFRTNERTIRRWEKATIPIPYTAVLAMKYLTLTAG